MAGWRGLLTLVLLAAALVSGWSVWNHRAPEPVRDPASGRSDYQLYDFELVVLDEQGKEAFTLRAPQLARQPGDQSLDLANPVFLFPADGGPADGGEDGAARWEMRSNQAWVSPNGGQVRLRGDVRAENPGATGGSTELTTERLDVYPHEDRASTDSPVRIERPGSIIRGRGLRVDLATKHYVLQSDVETRYVPNR